MSAAGETVAVVGESGSGKSQLMMAAMGLLASNGEATRHGRLSRRRISSACRKRELEHASAGGKITMIFQEPMTSLDPLYTIGNQLIEPIRAAQRHRRAGGASARRSSCWSSCGSPSRSGACDPIRMSCRAASASA